MSKWIDQTLRAINFTVDLLDGSVADLYKNFMKFSSSTFLSITIYSFIYVCVSVFIARVHLCIVHFWMRVSNLLKIYENVEEVFDLIVFRPDDLFLLKDF